MSGRSCRQLFASLPHSDLAVQRRLGKAGPNRRQHGVRGQRFLPQFSLQPCERRAQVSIHLRWCINGVDICVVDRRVRILCRHKGTNHQETLRCLYLCGICGGEDDGALAWATCIDGGLPAKNRAKERWATNTRPHMYLGVQTRAVCFRLFLAKESGGPLPLLGHILPSSICF